jgi:hypothetical protein
VVLPPEADFEVAATPDLGVSEMQDVRDLAAGLDAWVIGRGHHREGQQKASAAGLARLGRSLRGTQFWAHPIYGRRERFTASAVRGLAGEAAHA